MAETRLPREAEEQVVDFEVASLLFGLTLLGASAVVVSLAVNHSREKARLRRQEALFDGAEKLLLLVERIRTADPTPGKKGGP